MADVLLATDADWTFDEVAGALADDATRVSRVRSGRDLLAVTEELQPELVILDLQIGSMGGMAACLELRAESDAGRLRYQNVLMLLDRSADVFLARQARADGWLIKPLNAFRLRRGRAALAEGGTFHESAG
ncbi:MAG: response regulator [bacterium]|nr:response regulator [bacterium]MXV91774.1 response regulator [Acidimicrobiia bacterium]MYC46232.1 response regulator [Acidimicrobiia bacterium]MYI18841.1 response regulator [Acidimicrobiia bacterium]